MACCSDVAHAALFYDPMTVMQRRLVFLLGSGVSRAARMPSMSEITDVVNSGIRDGRPYKKGTDERYYNSPAIIDMKPDAFASVLAFIREIQRLCSKYFRREVSYEDTAYVVWQINDEQSGNYENPALVPLIRLFHRRFPGTRLPELAREAQTYIHCVVEDMLSKAPAGLGHVPCLVDACRSGELDNVDVFTLNHDTLLEQEFAAANIGFTDGFELKTESCDYWDTTAFTCGSRKVRLGKLHGSVDWHVYRPDSSNRIRQMIGKAKGCDSWHTCDLSGNLQWPIVSESAMLIGSFNKILEYTGGVFADLFCTFRSSLRDTRHLVVSGYGFRDKAVNHSIIEWLHSSPDRKLLVAHEDHLTYKQSARIAIRNVFDSSFPQITGTGSWFQETSFTQMQRWLLE